VLISAVTAPGSDAMPWDESICCALGEHKHAGGLGCRVDSSISGRWNREAPATWRQLQDAAPRERLLAAWEESPALPDGIGSAARRGPTA